MCFASATASKDDLSDKIYDYLKKNISEITWLDVNFAPQNYTQFAIRYYPCAYPIQNRIDTFLPKILQENACVVKYPGVHIKTEGYCTLSSIVMNCNA